MKVDFKPGEYANKTMGVYQKKFIKRNKEVTINFPLVRDDDDDEPPEHDPEAIKSWIYPSNYDQRFSYAVTGLTFIRDYQHSLVQNGLMENSLVVLPTGLGKTFIAAVIMYNYYRWFPEGKIIFMAHSKPLVMQQVIFVWILNEITGGSLSQNRRISRTRYSNDDWEHFLGSEERKVLERKAGVFLNTTDSQKRHI